MNRFRGWKQVFSFTYGHAVHSKSYIVTTAVVAIVMLLAGGLTSYFLLSSVEDMLNEQMGISTEVTNETPVISQKNAPEEEIDYFNGTIATLNATDVKSFSLEEDLISESERFKNTKVQNDVAASYDELKKMVENGKADIGLYASLEDNDIIITAISREGGYAEKSDVSQASFIYKTALEKRLFEQNNISEEQRMAYVKGVRYNVISMDKEQNVFAMLLKYIAPVVSGFILYFMVLLYGQEVCKEISTEKTSKLVENLLSSVHPYALLTGKIFATTANALVQVLIWGVFAVVGFKTGFLIKASSFAEGIVVNMVLSQVTGIVFSSFAFSFGAILLALILFILGFLFFQVLAGVAGSFVTKSEETANVQSIYTMPILFSWLISYFASLTENEKLLSVLRYIPLTAPFAAPVDILTGTMSLTQVLICVAIMIVFTMVFIMFAAKIYKGMVVYNGAKVKFNTVISMLKEKN